MAEEHPAFAAKPHKPHGPNTTFADRQAARVGRKAVRKAEDKSVTSGEAKGDDDVERYATGGGWYEVDGEKYHGRDAALKALGR